MTRLHILFFIVLFFFSFGEPEQSQDAFEKEIASVLRSQILTEAEWALQQQPVTVTAYASRRTTGTIHDFYSEGDYWWPDSTNADGPYIQRDGMTNPGNFTAHRLAMIRFSRIMGALAAAYQLAYDDKYVRHSLIHLRAWFVHTKTRMNPSLQFAQAIKGRATGRGIGIIDTIHLMEVAQGVLVMEKSKAFDSATATGVRQWFADYLVWLTSHPYGKDEMNASNNHGTCWVMQVASFSRLTRNDQLLDFCRDRYKAVLLPHQMAADGSFPLELKRTKPYGYSIFNLDAMVMICQILSDRRNNLWTYQTPDGKSIRKGIEFLYPYLKDKSIWPFQQDVMYWHNWPVAQPALVFGAVAYQEKSWMNCWASMNHHPEAEEVIRNLPVRHPSIWLE